MKKTSDRKRDLERKLVLKSETLRRLDLAAVTGGGDADMACGAGASCANNTCVCTGTVPKGFG